MEELFLMLVYAEGFLLIALVICGIERITSRGKRKRPRSAGAQRSRKKNNHNPIIVGKEEGSQGWE